MKRFIYYSLLFVMPILVIATALEVGIRSLPNVYKYKYNWMQQNADSVEILVLGNSYSYLGISPHYIDSTKAFNLANVAQDYHLDKFLLQYWGARYNNLKYVVLPVSYSSWFQDRLENGNGKYRCRYYKLYMDCDLYQGNPLQYLEISDIRSVSKRIVNLFKRRVDVGCDKWGWEALNIKGPVSKREAEIDAKGHTVTNYLKSQKNYQLIKEMALFCRKRNAKLLLINMPTCSYYYLALSHEQLCVIRNLNSKIQKECNVLYLDYMQDSRFNEMDFTDGHHLNATGAVKFSRILHDDIQQFR